MRISDWSSDVCSSDLVGVPQSSVAEWLREHTSGGARIGYDPWLHTKRWVNQAAEALAEKGAELIAVNSNPDDAVWPDRPAPSRSDEHTSELQSLMRISYAVFCLKK